MENKGNQQIRSPSLIAKELMRQSFMLYYLDSGKTETEAEQKWQEFLKAGVDYKITKQIKYN